MTEYNFDGVIEKGVETFQLSEDELIEVKISEIIAESIVQPLTTYVVMLINTSSLCITRARTRPVGSNQWGAFFATQRICHNCDHSFDDCFNRQNFTPVMSTNCDAQAFELQIIDDPDANGTARGAAYTITPQCKDPATGKPVAGGVIGLG